VITIVRKRKLAVNIVLFFVGCVLIVAGVTIRAFLEE